MISVTILTKNSARYLPRVLEALSDFDELVVYDTGSTDSTLEIAKGYPNVSIHEGPLEGFGVTHNKASALARHDWILSVDSDEVMTEDLSAEIDDLILDPSTVYSIARRNEYNGRWIRWCGWWPDRVCRLYHRKTTDFSHAEVHEAIQTKGLQIIPLNGKLLHFPYASTADFLAKMQVYSELFARQYKGRRQSSVTRAVLHGVFAFFKSYVLKRGIIGGREGFIISVYNANTAFYKYLKLWERNREVICVSLGRFQNSSRRY